MSQEIGYEVNKNENILHNTSILTEISISQRQCDDDCKEDEKKINYAIWTPKYYNLNTANRLIIAKRNEQIDEKIKLNFELRKIDNLIDAETAEINDLEMKLQELEEEKIESLRFISKQSMLIKCVDKQLNTKALVHEQIIPSKLEKQSLSINNIVSEIDLLNKTWLEKIPQVQNLIQSKIHITEEHRKYSAELAATEAAASLEEGDHQEVHRLLQQKSEQLETLRECLKSANEEHVNLLKQIAEETGNLNELMYKEINAQEDILSISVTHYKNINSLHKTLEEKRARNLNTEHCLLPAIERRELEAIAILQNNVIKKNDLCDKLNNLNQDIITQKKAIDKIEADIVCLEFHHEQENQRINSEILEIDISFLEVERKQEELLQNKDEAVVQLEKYENEIKTLSKAVKDSRTEISDFNVKCLELNADHNSIKESIVQLQKSLQNLSTSEIDIEGAEKENGRLRSSIAEMKLKMIERQKMYAEQLNEAEQIDLITTETKLTNVRNERNELHDVFEAKIQLRDSLMARETKTELAIQELSRYKPRDTKADVGILKRLNTKSPGKRVHFEGIAGPSSQSSENASVYKVTQARKPFNPFAKTGNSLDSPPTRLPTTKKIKHNK